MAVERRAERLLVRLGTCGEDRLGREPRRDERLVDPVSGQRVDEAGGITDQEHAAQPSADAYYAHKGTYVGMTKATLVSIDSGISGTLKVTATAERSYTMCDDPSGKAWQVVGPDPRSSSYTSVTSC